MNESSSFWRAESYIVTPRRRDGTGEITDSGGGPLGSYDAAGRLMDSSGQVLLLAPVRSKGGRVRRPEVEMPISNAEGHLLGTARVVKYTLGPRSKKVTAAVTNEGGDEVARLEPRDDKGLRLAVTAGGADVATVDIEEIKAGLFRKTRVYRVTTVGEITDALRPFVFALTTRYDALLVGVIAASMESSARD